MSICDCFMGLQQGHSNSCQISFLPDATLHSSCLKTCFIHLEKFFICIALSTEILFGFCLGFKVNIWLLSSLELWCICHQDGFGVLIPFWGLPFSFLGLVSFSFCIVAVYLMFSISGTWISIYWVSHLISISSLLIQPSKNYFYSTDLWSSWTSPPVSDLTKWKVCWVRTCQPRAPSYTLQLSLTIAGKNELRK